MDPRYLRIDPPGRDHTHCVGPLEGAAAIEYWLQQEGFSQKYGFRYYRFGDQFWAHSIDGQPDARSKVFHPSAWPYSIQNGQGGGGDATLRET